MNGHGLLAREACAATESATGPGRGFRITREGREAWEEFEGTEIRRKNPALPLTAYFDPVAYGLAATVKPKLHVMKAQGQREMG